MKKLAILLVVLMAAPLFAVTSTWTDNADGTATLVLAVEAGEGNIVGVALNVDADVAVDIDSILPAELNIFMDYAYEQELGDGYTYGEGDTDAANAAADQAAAGTVAMPAAAFCVSAGYLNGAAIAGADGAPTVTIVFSASATASVDLSANALRGGIVDVNGNELTLAGDTTALPITVGGAACPCYGDIADSLQQLNPDGVMDFGDINKIISVFAAGGFAAIDVATNPAYTCFDIADSLQQQCQFDGVVDFGDINKAISLFAANGFGGLCISCP